MNEWMINEWMNAKLPLLNTPNIWNSVLSKDTGKFIHGYFYNKIQPWKKNTDPHIIVWLEQCQNTRL